MAESLDALLGRVLAAYRRPLRYQEQLKGPLPEPFQPILRLAAGKALPDLEILCRRWQTTPEELRQAAVFFIEQACLERSEDPYRILGLRPGAELRQIQTHYHLLMLLFHPDRIEATDNWRDVYAARINQAYQRLCRPVRRRSRVPGERVNAAPKSASAFPLHRRRRFHPRGLLFYLVQRFPRLIRHLPHLILGGGAVVTGGLMVHLYLSRSGTELASPSGAKTVEEKALSEPWEDTQAPLVWSPRLERPLLPSIRAVAPLPAVAGSKKEVSVTEETPEAEAAHTSHPEQGGERPSSERGSALREQSRSVSSRQFHGEGARPEDSSQKPAVEDALAFDSRKEAVVASKRREAEAESPPAALDATGENLRQERMQQLLRRFVAAYQQGDLETFLALFSADARTNEYFGKSALREDYARFFTTTESRELHLKELQWQWEGDTAQGKGRYVARVRKPTGIVETRGRIHFQVEERAGTGVITELFNTVEN